MPLTTDTTLELEGHIHQQSPQYVTTEHLQLYFNLIYKFNKTCTMVRAKKKAFIKEEIKHFLEELCGLPPEEIPYEIFTRESSLGACDVLVLHKEKLHGPSHRTEDSDAIHLASLDVGIIRMLLHFKSNILNKGL